MVENEILNGEGGGGGQSSELSENKGRGPPKKFRSRSFAAIPMSDHAQFVTRPPW